jgi:hypothetical protein
MTEVWYNPKIKPEHLARKAIVYLRQSTDKQVRQNKESRLLQYAVAERVRALGWQLRRSGGTRPPLRSRAGPPFRVSERLRWRRLRLDRNRPRQQI